MSLIGKHALITGGSRGIGRGIALKLAEQGAKIAVHYYQNQSAAEATLARIRELGSDGMLVQADVCRTEDVSRIFQQVGNEFGKVDIFVSNARPEAPTFYQAPPWTSAWTSGMRPWIRKPRPFSSRFGKQHD
jgi:NAD(P)-dependent dehydrogenase (short-subunit alcohol dehydrogenase family)